MHETTRAQDITGHPESMKLCPFPMEERDKDNLCVIGPGTQQPGKKLHEFLFGTGSGQCWTQCRAWMGVFFTG